MLHHAKYLRNGPKCKTKTVMESLKQRNNGQSDLITGEPNCITQDKSTYEVSMLCMSDT